MTIRESIKAQWESVKDKSTKEKLAYFWEYYGFRTVLILCIVSLAIYFAVDVITQKEYAYTGIFFGSKAQESADNYLADFARMEAIDTEEYEITVQSLLDIRLDGQVTEELYQTIATFTALVETNMVENIGAETNLFLYYSYLGYTADLRTLLTPEQLDTLAPHLIYMDAALIAEQQNTGEAPTIDYKNFPDPKDPDAMIDPVPVGIDLAAASEAFRNAYTFTSDSIALGICSTTEKTETAINFILYVFELQ